MLSWVDSEVRHFQLLKEICDHRSDWHAIPKRFGFTVSNNFNRTPKRTTARWKLKVEWKCRSMKWLDLKDLESLYPLELAEYTVANNINGKPEFNWWFKDEL